MIAPAGLFTRAKEGNGNEEWHEARVYQSSKRNADRRAEAGWTETGGRRIGPHSHVCPRPTSHRPTTPVSCLRDSRSRSRRSRATNWPSRNDGHDRALDGVKRRSLRIVPDRDTVKVRPVETPERVLQSPGSRTILVAGRGDAWRDKARRGPVVISGDTALP
ncbi:hypothetical protein ALC57_11543 [Trachymyrmex cornetzi]|uniref:Uncharacterized protein n=1 Tax=Trachymyrmex cornetzi TaxID=471704 RepID=A0A151J2C8_9HYME|nr:hypothetical protein ALC57_11543 [Trachymyrmex cornetzi]